MRLSDVLPPQDTHFESGRWDVGPAASEACDRCAAGIAFFGGGFRVGGCAGEGGHVGGLVSISLYKI